MTAPRTATPKWTAPLGNLVNSVAIADDGSRVVAGTYQHAYKENGSPTFATCAFDASGTKLWEHVIETTSEGAYWVALSGAGTFAAAGGQIIDTKNPDGLGFIQAFDAGSGAVLLDFRLSGDDVSARVNKVALSAAGDVLVAAAGYSLYYAFFDRGGYTEPKAIALESGGNWVDTVAISDDGRWIVTGASSGTITLFQQAGGVVTKVASGALPEGATCRCIVMTPDGDWFAASGGASSTGGYCCLFNTAAFPSTRAPVWTQEGKGPIYYVALSGAEGGAPPLAVSVTNVPGPARAGHAPQPSPGQIAALKTGGGAVPEIVTTYETVSAPNSASMDRAGKLLGVADGYPPGTDGHFYLLDASTLACLWTFTTANAMSWPIAVAADGSAIAAGSDDGSVYYFLPDA